MAGIANDYLIYPIMDLIKSEVQKVTNKAAVVGDPFAGTPAVRLIRDHPLDPDKVTGAHMKYESDYTVDIFMTFGSGDFLEGIPLSVDPDHPDWDFYMNWRLGAVTSIAKNPAGETLSTIAIGLNYENETGALIGTTVTRI